MSKNHSDNIDVTTGEAEQCFFTLKPITMFTRNTMIEGRLYALAMCLIEKQLLTTSNFSERMVDHFSAQKE